MGDVSLEEVHNWVRAELDGARQLGVLDISAVAPDPSGERVVCTVEVRTDIADDPHKAVALVDLDDHAWRVLDLSDALRAAWSPTGDRLAVLVQRDGTTTVWLLDAHSLEGDPRVVARLPGLEGAVESVTWSPDGERLALVVAQFGAEVADVHGSGTVQAPTEGDSWRPEVSPAPDGGRRILHVWTPPPPTSTSTPGPEGDGTVVPLARELNVWEAGWYGGRSLTVLASEAPGEGAWYSASLWSVDLDGHRTPLYEPSTQLAQPSAPASGGRWSVLAGLASDRGLLAGAVVVGGSDGAVFCDTLAVDVTDHRWLDEERILFCGSRRHETVVGVLSIAGDLSTSAQELLVTTATNGLHQPELGGLTVSGALVLALEQHDQPPSLCVVRDGRPEVVVSTAGPGTKYVVEQSGTTRVCTWASSDGLEIDGLLTTPDRPGPHRLVVLIHGGPVAAWHDCWLGKDPYTALLVARGFAVLRPNPRGSVGRGSDFVREVVPNMGDRDVDDITAGVARLVRDGVAVGGQVGVTGNSYGGYMAAWIPCISDVFAASVSRSPVTDWRSQHLTSNLREFDEFFVDGDPFDPESHYATRSPLLQHQHIRTPMLLTAGARDLATPASQAQQMYRALLRTGVPSGLVVYPEEGHGVRAPLARADQIARMVHWFEMYLDGTPHHHQEAP